MKLYVNMCSHCNERIYLDVSAKSRSELRRIIGSSKFYIQCKNCHSESSYHTSEIYAESEANSTVAGGVVGGIIGLIGGPIGALIGSSIGVAIGNSSDGEDKNRVDFFNRST